MAGQEDAVPGVLRRAGNFLPQRDELLAQALDFFLQGGGTGSAFELRDLLFEFLRDRLVVCVHLPYRFGS